MGFVCSVHMKDEAAFEDGKKTRERRRKILSFATYRDVAYSSVVDHIIPFVELAHMRSINSCSGKKKIKDGFDASFFLLKKYICEG